MCRGVCKDMQVMQVMQGFPVLSAGFSNVVRHFRLGASWTTALSSLPHRALEARQLGLVLIWAFAAEKMLQNTILPMPRWPATTLLSQSLTALSNHRASLQTAFYHSHPEHVRVVQMFTIDRITLHLRFSNISSWTLFQPPHVHGCELSFHCSVQ